MRVEAPMHEKFDDWRRAVVYVCSGISVNYPEARFEVSLVRHNLNKQMLCEAREVSKVLQIFCSRFPMASIYYHPHVNQGLVAEIHCHCRGEGRSSCCKYNGRHREKALIYLVEKESGLTHGAQTEEGRPGQPTSR